MKADMKSQILEIIEFEINPILKEHGGQVEFKSLVNNVLVLEMRGQCAYCASSAVTLERIIKPTLVRKIKRLKDVRLDDSTDSDMIDFALKILKSK